MTDDLDKIVDKWVGRIRGSLLDLSILYLSAFQSEEVYAYSIVKHLESRWGKKRSPPMPTIYSTIERLIKAGYLKPAPKIIGGRMSKILVIQDKGWEAMEKMMENLKSILTTFDLDDKDLKLQERFERSKEDKE